MIQGFSTHTRTQLRVEGILAHIRTTRSSFAFGMFGRLGQKMLLRKLPSLKNVPRFSKWLVILCGVDADPIDWALKQLDRISNTRS